MEAKEFNRLLKEIPNSDKAIEKLYRYFYPRAINHFSIKYNLTLAEEATQDFFINLFDICRHQEYVNSPTSWVYTCIENIIKRKIQTESKYCSFYENTAFSDSTKAIENKIYTDQLLKGLNETQQKIIYLIHWEGYSEKEVAKILNLTYDNVRKIYSRALKKLRNLL